MKMLQKNEWVTCKKLHQWLFKLPSTVYIQHYRNRTENLVGKIVQTNKYLTEYNQEVNLIFIEQQRFDLDSNGAHKYDKEGGILLEHFIAVYLESELELVNVDNITSLEKQVHVPVLNALIKWLNL